MQLIWREIPMAGGVSILVGGYVARYQGRSNSEQELKTFQALDGDSRAYTDATVLAEAGARLPEAVSPCTLRIRSRPAEVSSN